MSKFCGKIGYSLTVEVKPGVWEERIEEKNAIGDILKSIRQADSSSSVNPNITINNTISLIADPFMTQNYHLIRYVKFGGNNVAWNVKSVEMQYPRLIIMLGGVYNAQ